MRGGCCVRRWSCDRWPVYGPRVIDALVVCWAVLRAQAGKRLAPMLPALVPLLRRDGELALTDEEAGQLMRISAATMDRRLAPERAKLVLRGRSHTKPGSLLKSQIPVRTWADWDDAVPGFVEIDLVGHEGGVASGQFCFTLTVTDIATAWTVNRSVPNKAEMGFRGAAVCAGPVPLRDVSESQEACQPLADRLPSFSAGTPRFYAQQPHHDHNYARP